MNDIVKAETTALVAGGFEGMANAGFENQTRDDYTIPMIKLLQPQSPELEAVKGAKAGMFFNTGTQELYEQLVVVPVQTEQKILEWIPKKMGGGLAAIHEVTSPIAIQNPGYKTGKVYLGEKDKANELVQTFYVYALAKSNEGGFQPVVIPFTSTKITRYRNWMTKARSIEMKRADGRAGSYPLFAHRYVMTSGKEVANGETYYNVNIAFDGTDKAAECRFDANDQVVAAAIEFSKSITAGAAKVDHAQNQSTASPQGDTGDDGMPF